MQPEPARCLETQDKRDLETSWGRGGGCMEPVLPVHSAPCTPELRRHPQGQGRASSPRRPRPGYSTILEGWKIPPILSKARLRNGLE